MSQDDFYHNPGEDCAFSVSDIKTSDLLKKMIAFRQSLFIKLKGLLY